MPKSLALPTKSATELPTTAAKEARMEPVLMVNLIDLDDLDPTFRAAVLKGKIGETVRLAGDDVGLALACDELTAALTADAIRAEGLRNGEKPCRTYIRKYGKWRELPHTAVLTINTDSQVKLSPIWFATGVEPVELERIDSLGRD